MESLPVGYTNNKRMIGKLFTKWWFHRDFVPEVKWYLRSKGLPSKAVLLDNAPSHPKELTPHDGGIRCELLPANTTSILQLMDQGIIKTVKVQSESSAEYQKCLRQQCG